MRQFSNLGCLRPAELPELQDDLRLSRLGIWPIVGGSGVSEESLWFADAADLEYAVFPRTCSRYPVGIR
jgi:hypothetical protein